MGLLAIIYCLLFMVIDASSNVGAIADNTTDALLVFVDDKQESLCSILVDGREVSCHVPYHTFNNPTGIGYDNVKRMVYVAEETGAVYRMALDKPGVLDHIINEYVIHRIVDIALDGKGHIFIAGGDTIYRANIDGTGLMEWFGFGLVHGLTGITVDTNQGYLLWTSSVDNSVYRSSSRVNTTGRVIACCTDDPHGIYYEPASLKFYWCSRTRSIIYEADSDGKGVRPTAEIPNADIAHIVGYGGHLYVTGERDGPTYHIFDIHDGSYKTIFSSTTSRPWAISIRPGNIPQGVSQIEENTLEDTVSQERLASEADDRPKSLTTSEGSVTPGITTIQEEGILASFSSMTMGLIVGGSVLLFAIIGSLVIVVLCIKSRRRQGDKTETENVAGGTLTNNRTESQSSANHDPQITVTYYDDTGPPIPPRENCQNTAHIRESDHPYSDPVDQAYEQPSPNTMNIQEHIENRYMYLEPMTRGVDDATGYENTLKNADVYLDPVDQTNEQSSQGTMKIQEQTENRDIYLSNTPEPVTSVDDATGYENTLENTNVYLSHVNQYELPRRSMQGPIYDNNAYTILN